MSLSSIKRSPLVQRQTLSATRLPHKTPVPPPPSPSSTTFALFKANQRTSNVETLTNSSSVRRNSAARCRTPCAINAPARPVAPHLLLPRWRPPPVFLPCDGKNRLVHDGATCAFERAVQAQRTALELEDDVTLLVRFGFKVGEHPFSSSS